ncbi:MAG TPA: phage portal protein [Mycobacteriales bacterium]
MPLPVPGTPWPPPDLKPVTDRLVTWGAWWSGDPDMLSAVYGGAVDFTRSGFFASEQGGIRGRIINTLSRWFWGTQPPAHEQRQKLHIGLAGTIASTSADLLFSEPPKITAQNQKAQDRLDELVDDGVHATLLEAADACAGMGGAYLRVCWDREAHPDGPWLDAVHADAAIPEWVQGRLSAVTFWRVIGRDGDKVVRHLERHEKGVVLHGVYVGTDTGLGKPVPLAAYPDTKDLLPVVTTGVPRLLVEYVPNMRPNKLWRGMPSAAYLGRADIAGSEPALDALDETWSSWMRDLRLAKARLIVPDVYLQQQGRGQGARFDADQEIYATLNMLPQTGGAPQISEVQFAIRTADHRDTAAALVAQILRDSGYSGQTFGEVTESGAVTATEVHARQSRSYTTRSRKIVYWRPALARILETLLMVDAAVFSSGVVAELPALEFPDAVSEDPGAVAQTVQLLVAADAISTRTRVQMVHPDWDDTAVDNEVTAIRAEAASTGADPVQVLRDLHGAGPEEPVNPDAGQP